MSNKITEFAGISGLIRSVINRNKRTAEAETKPEAELSKEEPAAEPEPCIAAFGYAIMMPPPDDDNQEIVVIGNFMIKNIGNDILHHPMICIWVKPPGSAKLGGKIIIPEKMADAPSQEQWIHVHQDWKERVKNSGEYWLKPRHCEELKPGETIVFSNFELVLAKQNMPSFTADGFVYFKELPNGVPSLNTILIHF